MNRKLFPISVLAVFFNSPVFSQDTLAPGISFSAFHEDYDLSGDVVIARQYSDSSKVYFGLFDQGDDRSWSLVEQITAELGQSYDLSIDGEQIVIVGTTETSGTMNFYQKTDGQWRPGSIVSTRGRSYTSKEYVEISHDNAAFLIDTTLYLYRKNDSVWNLEQEIVTSTEYDGSYIADVSLHNNTLAVAVADKVIIYKRAEGNWSQEAVLTQPEDQVYGQVESVAVHDNTLLVGRSIDSHFYSRDNSGNWSPKQVVIRSGSVALNNTRAIVAGYEEVYHYAKNSHGKWRETGNINAGVVGSDGQVSQFYLNGGAHVAFNDSVVIYGGHGSLVASNLPALDAAACVDTGQIGDGWGWNGSSSCILPIADISNRCDYSSASLNSGWGWNSFTQTSCEPVQLQCVDTGVIGDGWGWNGTASCRLYGQD